MKAGIYWGHFWYLPTTVFQFHIPTMSIHDGVGDSGLISMIKLNI